jgi:hypothetical protein
MDDALRAYGTGHADGLAGRRDDTRTDDPDYVTGLLDGQMVAFSEALIAAVRKALGETA